MCEFFRGGGPHGPKFKIQVARPVGNYDESVFLEYGLALLDKVIRSTHDTRKKGKREYDLTEDLNNMTVPMMPSFHMSLSPTSPLPSKLHKNRNTVHKFDDRAPSMSKETYRIIVSMMKSGGCYIVAGMIVVILSIVLYMSFDVLMDMVIANRVNKRLNTFTPVNSIYNFACIVA